MLLCHGGRLIFRFHSYEGRIHLRHRRSLPLQRSRGVLRNLEAVKTVVKMDTGGTSMVRFIEATLSRLLTPSAQPLLSPCSAPAQRSAQGAQDVLRLSIILVCTVRADAGCRCRGVTMSWQMACVNLEGDSRYSV